MVFDFIDAAEAYVGNMTIALTANLPFNRGSETINFNVETLTYCTTSANKLSITCLTTQLT